MLIVPEFVRHRRFRLSAGIPQQRQGEEEKRVTGGKAWKGDG